MTYNAPFLGIKWVKTRDVWNRAYRNPKRHGTKGSKLGLSQVNWDIWSPLSILMFQCVFLTLAAVDSTLLTVDRLCSQSFKPGMWWSYSLYLVSSQALELWFRVDVFQVLCFSTWVRLRIWSGVLNRAVWMSGPGTINNLPILNPILVVTTSNNGKSCAPNVLHCLFVTFLQTAFTSSKIGSPFSCFSPFYVIGALLY